MSNLFWLTEAQMARLQPFFPVTSVKMVENAGWPGEDIGQAACVVMLRRGSG
jgi:hypothetical protein